MIAAGRECQEPVSLDGLDIGIIEGKLLDLSDVGCEILRVGQVSILIILESVVRRRRIYLRIESCQKFVISFFIGRIKTDDRVFAGKFLVLILRQCAEHTPVFHMMAVDQDMI